MKILYRVLDYFLHFKGHAYWTVGVKIQNLPLEFHCMKKLQLFYYCDLFKMESLHRGELFCVNVHEENCALNEL